MYEQGERERVVGILKGWQFDRKQHGSLYDPGSQTHTMAVAVILTTVELAVIQVPVLKSLIVRQ